MVSGPADGGLFATVPGAGKNEFYYPEKKKKPYRENIEESSKAVKVSERGWGTITRKRVTSELWQVWQNGGTDRKQDCRPQTPFPSPVCPLVFPPFLFLTSVL